jgi:hypothetical protein
MRLTITRILARMDSLIVPSIVVLARTEATYSRAMSRSVASPRTFTARSFTSSAS